MTGAPGFLDTHLERRPTGRVGQVVSAHVSTEINPLPRRRRAYPFVNPLLIWIIGDSQTFQSSPYGGLRFGQVLESLLEGLPPPLNFLDQGEALGKSVEAAGDVVEDRDIGRIRRRLRARKVVRVRERFCPTSDFRIWRNRGYRELGFFMVPSLKGRGVKGRFGLAPASSFKGRQVVPGRSPSGRDTERHRSARR